MPDSVEQGVNKLGDAERRFVPAPDDNSARSSRSKIQSVPRILRSHSNLDKSFEPRVLAMGPIHHDKCTEAEKFKYALAADFVKYSGCTYDQLYKQILDHIDSCHMQEISRLCKIYQVPLWFRIFDTKRTMPLDRCREHLLVYSISSFVCIFLEYELTIFDLLLRILKHYLKR